MGRTDINNRKMKKEHVLNCSFSAWYPKFKEISFKSLILPLPKEFIDYLHKDGIVLPESSIQASSSQNPPDDSNEDDEIDWESGNSSEAMAPEFPEFEHLVKKSIQKLGGCVFPKLNWSCPKDATWISFDKTLKCTCPSDVYILLKSSDFIGHDLSQPFDHCIDNFSQGERPNVSYDLVLRKWHDLQHGMEFRCFVKNKKLIAVSQRHHVQYYDFIQVQEEEIMAEIKGFFYRMISNRFPNEDYIFDIYRQDKENILLVDFNPFDAVTDSLLFTWDELENYSGEAEHPEFRYVKRKEGVQPNPYAVYALPLDFVDLASGQDPRKLMDLLKLRRRNNDSDTISSDSND